MTSGLISVVSTTLDIWSSPLSTTPTRPRVCTSPSVHASPHTRVTAQVPAGPAKFCACFTFHSKATQGVIWSEPSKRSILVGYYISANVTYSNFNGAALQTSNNCVYHYPEKYFCSDVAIAWWHGAAPRFFLARASFMYVAALVRGSSTYNTYTHGIVRIRTHP